MTEKRKTEPRRGMGQAMDRTVVLVGLMGAGKTCIGRRLAEQLGCAFVDADEEIEKAAGCSISDIFEIYGEHAFRDGERRVICRLLSDPPHVLATGGGAYMDDEVRRRVAECAVSVWLRADMDLLMQRTQRRAGRPLLENGDHRATLKRLMDERYPVYAEADITVDSAREMPEVTVERVLAALTAFETPDKATAGAVP